MTCALLSDFVTKTKRNSKTNMGYWEGCGKALTWNDIVVGLWVPNTSVRLYEDRRTTLFSVVEREAACAGQGLRGVPFPGSPVPCPPPPPPGNPRQPVLVLALG